MSRKIALYLRDIHLFCGRVLEYTQNLSQSALVADQRTYDATLRNLELIGEAVKNIPEDVRVLYPHIEWRKIAGFRDVLAHAYFGVQDEVIWDVVANKIPELFEVVTHAMPRYPLEDEAAL